MIISLTFSQGIAEQGHFVTVNQSLETSSISKSYMAKGLGDDFVGGGEFHRIMVRRYRP